MRNASPPSIIVVHDRDWHRWIGPVTGHLLLCVLKVVTELSGHHICSIKKNDIFTCFFNIEKTYYIFF